MAAPDAIRALCATFSLHRAHYTSGSYNETELRREFLDPLFTALGWDVDNKAGYADAYKDVIHEDAIRIGGYTKAPDYCFRIGGTRKFFVEAKKPSVNIEGDMAPAYQLRRYGWSAKLPLSVLSDFEEFAVYDTRVKPVKTDRPAKARILYYTFDQYVEKWDELAAVFSRDAILRGSFDKYAETTKGKRGTGAVDDTFLAEIERWRDLLARNLALRNPGLTVRDLNYAVQKTIDRIIFLRICEDRGTEDYGRLQSLLNGGRTYPRLQQFFHQADARYNSGLFHFDSGEKGRTGTPDTLTTRLEIDDKTLKDILKNLYYPDSPYEFSVLSADILGQVYEQFLGKTIRLTDGHQAKIEEKPEVRKAGGVYYTPSYIVDYIVRNTLGRLLDGDDPASPQPVSMAKAAGIKVLDPACGSGSFLIVAYQYLLDWHLRQYTAAPATGELDLEKAKPHAAGKTPKVYQAAGDVWRLTTAERKRILLNNIHGVDIDSQAVEVTKLSLLLKVLEGETQQQLQRDFLSERQRILPDLGRNIQCGNALIGPDFYDQLELSLLDEETRYRINVFDWQAAFPEAFKQGGFDCVIGNPPYILMQILEQPQVFEYLLTHYEAAAYKIDTYQVFIERLIQLLKKQGFGSFIAPNTFFRNVHSESLRRLLLREGRLLLLQNHLYPVFRAASVDTCIFVFKRGEPLSPFHSIQVETCHSPTTRLASVVIGNAWIEHPHAEFGTELSGSDSALVDRMGAYSKLGAYADAYFGIQTFDRKTYVSDSQLFPVSKPTIDGSDFSRYALPIRSAWVCLTKDAVKSGGNQTVYEQDRIVVRQIGSTPIATFCEGGLYTLNTVYNIYVTKNSSPQLLYLLGILSSRVIAWFWTKSFSDGKKTFPKIKKRQLLGIPIRPIDFDNPADVALHDKMVQLVERMLELNRKKAEERNPETLRRLESDIAITDRQIDRLVYELYALTPAEIAIVEGGKG
ncbi:MAG: N-6 DNA methylase [Candidatus Marinimicrobia bacterium]|nr:N-6 DNA methylase [Candidatus Neomarinimicrobiota bacterium]